MSNPTVRSLKDYFLYLRAFVAQKQMVQQSYALTMTSKNDYQGDIVIPKGKFAFTDGSILHGYENILIVNYAVIRQGYSYEYLRPDGWYFRYDKDPDRAKPHIHAVNHLHVNADDPRYPSHDTNFEEIIEFILAAFYP